MLALLERPALSPAEAAEVLGVSRSTVYSLLDHGELRRFRVGRQVRIPTVDVLALIGGGDDVA